MLHQGEVRIDLYNKIVYCLSVPSKSRPLGCRASNGMGPFSEMDGILRIILDRMPLYCDISVMGA